MNDIFLSYAREDLERIRTIAKMLERQGWSVFLDRTIPAGKTWRDVIGKALSDARCVVVVWSKESIKSTWVQEEAEEGRERGILVPVLMDDVKPPLGFRSLQARNMINWGNEETTPAVQGLLGDITSVLGLPSSSVASDEPLSYNNGTSKPQVSHRRPSSERQIQTKGGSAVSKPKIWQPVLLIIVGWAVGGAIGLTMIFDVGPAFGFPFIGAIGWGIAGSIGGFAIGQAFRLMEFSVRKEQVILYTTGWAVGSAVGGSLSWEFASVPGALIAGSLGGAIGGMITGHVFGLTNTPLHSSQVQMLTLGWAVAGGLGSLLSWSFRGYLYTTTFYAVVGAITGGTIGLVGGGLMLGWLSFHSNG